MYINIFSLFNYSKRGLDHNLIIYNDNIDCFICFMPSEPNNQIKKLSEFSHIIQKCKCNANIHLQCLNIWTQQTQSCPICRTKCFSKSRNYIVCIINIYVFIIFFYNLFICIFMFKYLLFQIYLFIKL